MYRSICLPRTLRVLIKYKLSIWSIGYCEKSCLRLTRVAAVVRSIPQKTMRIVDSALNVEHTWYPTAKPLDFSKGVDRAVWRQGSARASLPSSPSVNSIWIFLEGKRRRRNWLWIAPKGFLRQRNRLSSCLDEDSVLSPRQPSYKSS
jgi:hypothetical protein